MSSRACVRQKRIAANKSIFVLDCMEAIPTPTLFHQKLFLSQNLNSALRSPKSHCHRQRGLQGKAVGPEMWEFLKVPKLLEVLND